MAFKNGRKVHIDGEEWEWKVGKYSSLGTGDWWTWVYINSPTGKKYKVSTEGFSTAITPGKVKEYIETEILKKV
jgi:hypothetical protein